jgi:septal ring factor EnvC (AmiA/AmiB activator)
MSRFTTGRTCATSGGQRSIAIDGNSSEQRNLEIYKTINENHKDTRSLLIAFALGCSALSPCKPLSDLSVHDKTARIYTVRYDSVNAILPNEVLKEHKRVQEQQATVSELKSTVARQQREMEGLVARLNEHAAELQRVSDQIETIRPAPRIVINP